MFAWIHPCSEIKILEITISKMFTQHTFMKLDLFLSWNMISNYNRFKNINRCWLACHAPPALPFPKTTWSIACSFSNFHSSREGLSTPRSASGLQRASNRRPTGLEERPSSPSDKKAKSWRSWHQQINTRKFNDAGRKILYRGH